MEIKKLDPNAKIPTRGSDGAAGFDLYALSVEGDKFTVEGDGNIAHIQNESIVKVHTGIAMAIPKGYVGLVFPRSGLATKQGLRLANCVGVIDEDYRGEVIVCIHNDTIAGKPDIAEIQIGDRVAQIVFVKYEAFELNEVDELDSTKRGEGGFGSTGTH